MKLHPNKKPFSLSLGQRGEMIAWNFLRKHGYKLLEKNYRCPIGELDAVAEKDGRVVFIEIKTRAGESRGRAEESVDERKRLKLVRLASWYLKEKKQTESPARFDVVAVSWPEGGEPQIKLIENAFTADDPLI